MNSNVEIPLPHRYIPEQDLERLAQLRKREHGRCMAFLHPALKLEFEPESTKVLSAKVIFSEEMISFNQMVHGGLQAFLIDEAMTCALMGVGVYGATGELNLRYRASLRVEDSALIRVWIDKRYRKLYTVEAEILQKGKVCTQATARFMAQTVGN